MDDTTARLVVMSGCVDDLRVEVKRLEARIAELEALHTPRDTRKGEWPDDGQMIFEWREEIFTSVKPPPGCWWHGPASKHRRHIHFIWLPAPPAPSPPETEGT